MYGKTFQKLWRGSMRGKAMLQLVFIYMFCNCDRDGVYDCVPEEIADATGLDMPTVLSAIKDLESPDPDTRTPGNEGRRIIRLYDHRTWGWKIPNHEMYRRMGTEEHRKELAAERQRRFRNATVTHSNATVTMSPVSVCVSDTSSDVKRKERPSCVDDVIAYFNELGWGKERSDFEGHSFWDRNTSGGWRVGRNSMKDWKAACRTWKRNNYGEKQFYAKNLVTRKSMI